MLGSLHRSSLVLLMVALLALTGCPGKKKQPLGGDGDTAGVEESDLGGSGGSGSLDLANRGVPIDSAPGPLDDIHFGYDSTDLDDEARQILQRNADWLMSNKAVRIELEGHCDDRGTAEYNLALGAKRAASAKSYLTSLGVQSDRVTTISYGEELPLCGDPTDSCWARNRRARFVVVGE